MSLDSLLSAFRQTAVGLPDRRTGRNTRYEVSDAADCALACCFTHCESFLEFQRRMDQDGSRSNCQTLFGVGRVPCDNQIRNLLDGIQPAAFDPLFLLPRLANSAGAGRAPQPCQPSDAPAGRRQDLDRSVNLFISSSSTTFTHHLDGHIENRCLPGAQLALPGLPPQTLVASAAGLVAPTPRRLSVRLGLAPLRVNDDARPERPGLLPSYCNTHPQPPALHGDLTPLSACSSGSMGENARFNRSNNLRNTAHSTPECGKRIGIICLSADDVISG